MKLTINNIPVEFRKGETILSVAERMGLEIPTMCYFKELRPEASCMVCVVKDVKTGKLLPSCESKAYEGMEISTNDDTVLEARKTALDLLVSDHVGDCYAPCQNICPAGMDIPAMNRLIATGKDQQALKKIKETIPFPVTLGYICPAPCEKGCRRKDADETVGICMIKRYAGEQDLNLDQPFLPKKAIASGKRVSVIGAGIAGLSAAYYLLLNGHQVDIYEKNEQPGGEVLNVSTELLPQSLFFKEVALIERLGAKLHYLQYIDADDIDAQLKAYDAILLSTGTETYLAPFGVDCSRSGVKVTNYHTSEPKIFAAGGSVRNLKMAVQALAQGREAAEHIQAYLNPSYRVSEKPFNSSFGKLDKAEAMEYLKEASPEKAIKRQQHTWLNSYTADEARKEASRCMHCDCRETGNCQLQLLSTQYKAKQSRFKGNERKHVKKYVQHEVVVFEPEKCIKCGICVKLTEKEKEKFGFTFVGRGFDVRAHMPFDTNLHAALTHTALKVAEACPTGAICEKECP